LRATLARGGHSAGATSSCVNTGPIESNTPSRRISAWNSAAAKLFVGWLDGEHDRNLMRFIFRSPAAPRLIDDWQDRARRVVAEFRADFSRRLDDSTMRGLIEELSQTSPLFARLWRDQAVLAREGGERRFLAPARRFRQSTLVFASHPETKLVCLTPIDGGPGRS